MNHFRFHLTLCIFLAILCVLVCLPGCAPVQAQEEPGLPIPATSATSKPLNTAKPSQTPAEIPSTATATSRPQVEVCPPFSGWSRDRLIKSISNPFDPPVVGSDDPHQGVDFSDIDPDFEYAREGLTVNAVLAGTVAGIIVDRFPYGNAVMIETSVDELPPELSIPEEYSQPAVVSALTCPSGAELREENGKPQAAYLLYAHLQGAPMVAVGDSVSCGQPLGKVGGSGNALSPHLHLEVRVGNAGQRFTSMAHYLSSASEVEMANYCAWRVNGAFALIDPMMLIERLP